MPTSQEIIDFLKTPGFINAACVALGAVAVQGFKYLSARNSAKEESKQTEDTNLLKDRKDFLDQHREMITQIQSEVESYRDENRLLRGDLSSALYRASKAELDTISLKAKIIELEYQLKKFNEDLSKFKDTLTDTTKNNLE